jgi:hypothetical protein
MRRGFEFTEKIEDSDDTDHVTETDGPGRPHVRFEEPPAAPIPVEANTQDPDSVVEHKKEAYADTAFAFLKNMKKTHRIKMLTENEVLFVKKLLKDKNHDYWKD